MSLAMHMGEDREPEVRAPEQWLMVPRCAVLLFFRDVTIALRYAQRRRHAPDCVVVGRVVGQRDGRIHFLPLGQGVVPLTIPAADIAGAALLGRHTWAELRLVRDRQQSGEPARVLPRTHFKELDRLRRQRGRLLSRGRARPITSPEKRTEP